MKKLSVIIFLSLYFLASTKSQNKVGININPPEFNLDVRSIDTNTEADLQLSNFDKTHYLRFYGGNPINKRPYILFNLTDTLRIASSNPDLSTFKELITINPNGLLGINNINPQYELDVIGLNANNAAEINVRMTDNSNFIRLYSGRLSDPTSKVIWKDGTNLTFGDDEFSFTEKMRIQSDGKVGIGESSPLGKMHIKENSTTSLPQLRLTENENDFARIKMENTFHANAYWDIAGKADGNANFSRLNFFFSNPSTSGDRMTIMGNGNVGIGISTPQSKLDIQSIGDGNELLRFTTDRPWVFKQTGTGVNTNLALQSTVDAKKFEILGNDGTTQAAVFNLLNGNPSVFLVPNAGRVGIGTSNPLTELHIKDGTGWAYTTIESQSGGDAVLQFTDDTSLGANNDWTIRRDGSDLGNFQWRHDNTQRMTLTTEGRLGIGTSSPSSSLDVNGKIKLADDASAQVAGQMRWNNAESDFEGYDGNNWNSLTSKSVQGSVGTSQVRDIEGNVYKTVVIGTQEWMAENLRTTKFNDGSNIPYSPHSNVLKILDQSQSPAYTWPDSISANAFPYGALYNGYAADTVKLCPTGWHIPNEAEWTTLIDFLGGEIIAGGKMKSTGTLSGGDGLWTSPNFNASNSSGFSALPAGETTNNGIYFNFNLECNYWSRTEPTVLSRWHHWIYHTSDGINSNHAQRVRSLSIRCVKD